MTPTSDVQALRQQIDALQEQLEAEHLENARLRRILFSQYAKQPRLMRRLEFPISERAVILFEVLPEAFDLEAVLATAEKLGLEESEAAEHLRAYFQEGMLEDDEAARLFTKTGFRPYL